MYLPRNENAYYCTEGIVQKFFIFWAVSLFKLKNNLKHFSAQQQLKHILLSHTVVFVFSRESIIYHVHFKWSDSSEDVGRQKIIFCCFD